MLLGQGQDSTTVSLGLISTLREHFWTYSCPVNRAGVSLPKMLD